MDYMIPGNLILAVVIFTIGMIGVLWRRDAITIFHVDRADVQRRQPRVYHAGQALGKPEGVAVFLFVITIAAAEAAVGLALFIKIFDDRGHIEAETSTCCTLRRQWRAMDNFYRQIVQSLGLTAPLLVLLAAAIVVLAADVLMPRRRRGVLPWIAALGAAAAFLALVGRGLPGAARYAFSGALVLDRLAFWADCVILGMTLYLIAISPRWLRGARFRRANKRPAAFRRHGDDGARPLGRAAGALLNFELLSITFYILLGIEKRNPLSTEAGFKYFIVARPPPRVPAVRHCVRLGATGGQLRYVEILKLLGAHRLPCCVLLRRPG